MKTMIETASIQPNYPRRQFEVNWGKDCCFCRATYGRFLQREPVAIRNAVAMMESIGMTSSFGGVSVSLVIVVLSKVGFGSTVSGRMLPVYADAL